MGKDNSENEDAVAYMEDFEPQRERASSPLTELEEDVTMASQTQSQKTIPSASQESDKARPKPIKQTETAATSSNKRQRTLESMFGGSAKKAKLDAPAASKDGDKDTQLKRSTISMKSKNAADGPSLNSIPFSQSEFEGSLSTEEKDLLRLELDTMGKSWLKILKDEIRKPYFLSLKRFLREEGVTPDDSNPKCKVYPPAKCIYNWSNTPLGKVRCVIIGQDPYHGPGQAHGLCFSVRDGVAVPPSLRNMYSEIKAEYPDFVPPKHGNLTPWAEQSGVLMLNSALTVRAAQANSHAGKGWEDFTAAVINAVDKFGGANLGNAGGVGRGVVFLAWGSHAAKRVAHLSKTKHLILNSAHPSPLSAHRGFLGNGHFKKANEWLEKKYGPTGTVDWCKL